MAPSTKQFSDPCEYNPVAGRAAYIHEVHARAMWLVGAKGQWRICGKCAALPYFRRYRVRKQINRKAVDTPNGKKE